MKNIDNTIIDNSNALKERLNSISPGIIKEKMQEMLQRRNCVDTQFLLTKQYMIDDLSDLLANNNIVKVLYARRTKEKKYYEVICYSLPCDGYMYVIKLNSKMYGVVNTISVSFYTSLEIMFFDIRALYQTSENENWIMLEKQKPYVLFSNFC